MTKAQRTRERSIRRIAADLTRKAARPVIAASAAGSLALGIAAPAAPHHRSATEPVSVEAVVQPIPEFSTPIVTIRAADAHHGPHGHLSHTEGLEYRYVSFASPIVVTGGVPTRSR